MGLNMAESFQGMEKNVGKINISQLHEWFTVFEMDANPKVNMCLPNLDLKLTWPFSVGYLFLPSTNYWPL